ncbi:MAG: IS4 family transposase [Candidatus Competibacterales bacterium]|nr:IS4 family transposase [Candidatus Competibacterales bacterium]
MAARSAAGCCRSSSNPWPTSRYPRTFYLIIAWRILLLVTLGRDCPELDCEVLFTPEEWQAAWIVGRRQAPPETHPSLGEMLHLVGRFGGHLGRKGDGTPGPKALWQGLQCVMNYVETLQAVGHFQNSARSCG